MILTDMYKAQKITSAECRYDVIESTGSYELFESLLINKRKFNIGGLSFNYTDRPIHYNGLPQRNTEKAISKGNSNISSVFIPDAKNHLIGYGDINSTNDAFIIVFNGTHSIITIYIARGYKNDSIGLYHLFVDGELDEDIERLNNSSKACFKTL